VTLASVLLFATLGGCIGSPDGTVTAGVGQSSAELRQFPLDTLPTATISINEHELRVWLATDGDQHLEGMMYVSEDEVADDQGMLFVFPYEYLHAFWMKNTIISLDIAYARMDGTIVKIWTMPPLTYRTFPSIEPTMFALEVKAGTFERLGVREGDVIVIPDEVFKVSP
jgi:uncharacterized membrane protein (UPF0127 family)